MEPAGPFRPSAIGGAGTLGKVCFRRQRSRFDVGARWPERPGAARISLDRDVRRSARRVRSSRLLTRLPEDGRPSIRTRDMQTTTDAGGHLLRIDGKLEASAQGPLHEAKPCRRPADELVWDNLLRRPELCNQQPVRMLNQSIGPWIRRDGEPHDQRGNQRCGCRGDDPRCSSPTAHEDWVEMTGPSVGRECLRAGSVPRWFWFLLRS
jgi:hypothetical protein